MKGGWVTDSWGIAGVLWETNRAGYFTSPVPHDGISHTGTAAQQSYLPPVPPSLPLPLRGDLLSSLKEVDEQEDINKVGGCRLHTTVTVRVECDGDGRVQRARGWAWWVGGSQPTGASGGSHMLPGRCRQYGPGSTALPHRVAFCLPSLSVTQPHHHHHHHHHVGMHTHLSFKALLHLCLCSQVLRHFSYEHFYVVYCKFWDLDTGGLLTVGGG